MAGRQDGRLEELDALRGIAAVVVLLHHAWLFVAPAEPEGWAAGAKLLMEESPLRVLAAGRPAVVFFFVLSGYVLVRSLLARPLPWPVYAAQRAARLGPPVLASVLLSWALFHLCAAEELPEGLPSFAFATWAGPTDAAAALRQGLLLNTDADNGLNPVLWSLVHEWRIGLLLPLAPLLFRARVGLMLGLSVALMLASVAFGGVPLNTAFLGPDLPAGLATSAYFVLPFAAGAALAMAGPARRLSPTERQMALLALGLAALGSRHDIAAVAGSVLVILLVLERGADAPWLRHPIALWLGRVSFSLYLVHLPIQTALVHLFAASPADVPALMLLSFPLCLAAAAAMHALCEVPSQNFARGLAPAPEGRRGRERRLAR